MSAAAPPASHEPRRLGRYELITPLGRGGMATVYLARMHGTAGFARLVAVKVLHESLLGDAQLVTMFLDEARLAARIRHPNVVEVYDVETIDGELVIIMSWVEGASLAALQRALPVDAPMPVPLATRVVHDVLLGLHAAHELETEDGKPAGLVHRDVSPPNILVGIDGAVLLTDFGVATAADRLRSTGAHAIVGKLGYMSPEQIEGGALDRRTDVFASGIVLWELLAGRRLFAASSDDVVVRNVLDMAIEPPGAHRSGLPIALDEVCLRALERDPARRFPTAAAFAEALEEASGAAMMDVRDVGKLVAEKLAGAIERHRAAVRRAPVEAAALPAPEPALLTATMPTLVALPSRSSTGTGTSKRPRLFLAAALLGGTMLVVAIAIALGRKPNDVPTAPSEIRITEPDTDAASAVAIPESASPSLAAPSATSRPPKTRSPGSHRPPPPPPPPPRSAAPRKATGTFVPTEP